MTALSILLGGFGVGKAGAQSCVNGWATSITQYGITFTFDTTYACGVFANGDFWVAPPSPGGAVTLTAIAPIFDGTANGWQVNPDDPVTQGFDSRVANFDAGLVPGLPYAAAPGSSVVKAISAAAGECRPCLATAAVLTVLGHPPADGGAGYFRPPYPGTAKPLYRVDRLRADLLPSLAPVADAPSLGEIEDAFRRPWLDHKSGWTGAGLHPAENMPEYGAQVARQSGDGVLRLFLDDSVAAKQHALIDVVQVGLDLYHAYLMGTRWGPDGGHGSGRKLLISLAGVLLEEPAIIAAVQRAQRDDFGEDGSIVIPANAGLPLWGQDCPVESDYWRYWRFGNGSKTCTDPYGYIDGGIEPGGSYQFCCNSSPWRGHAMALRLLPALRCAWDASEFLTYEDRWVTFGAWSQPDPCAPYDGNPDNYGITYGPDGSGGCIPDSDPSDGVGRFPLNHGINAGEGYHGSTFHTTMWDAYRGSAPARQPCDLVFYDGFEDATTSWWSAAVAN